MKNHLTLVPFQEGRPCVLTLSVVFPLLQHSHSPLSLWKGLWLLHWQHAECLLAALFSILPVSAGFAVTVLTFPVPALTSTLKFRFLFTGKLPPSLPQENPT